MKRTTIRNVTFSICLAIIAAALFYGYKNFISPTVIGFINYPDYKFAEFDDANANRFIRVERIDWKKNEAADLSRYDAVYIFGMGLKLPPERLSALTEAINNGLHVYVQAATSRENNITSLAGKDLEYINECLNYGGRNNFKLLLNYTRRELNGKNFFSNAVTPPEKVPFDGFFHIGEGKVFASLDEFEAYRNALKLDNPGRPKVCFMTSTAGPEAEHIQAIVKSLEARKLNVYPIFGFRKRLEFIKKISPDMVILMPHGRFTTEVENEVTDYLTSRNIPLLCPINIHRPNAEWEKDQRGMVGGIMSQSIIMPELDGGIIPFVLAAQFKNERGLYVFKPLPKRISKFSRMVEKYLTLKTKNNKDKKLVIVYYKGPGRNALTAAGLEVVPSLFNTLKRLRQAGFYTGELPQDAKELEARIQSRAAIFNPYAKGSIAEFIKTAKPQFVPVKDYLQWVKQAMPDDLFAEVEQRYGKAPGPYMNTVSGNADGMALPVLQYGNIVLMPQSLPGYGENANKLIHGAKQAPPHPYIAAYLWARFGFKADAIIHFGTHGSLEFTPWKQVALSDYDWPDVLIGDMPHFYIYTINNIGEAVIAKRRSYAALVSHLTPPFMVSGLYDELEAIHDKIHACLNSGDNQLLRKQYEASIMELVKKKKIDAELNIKNITSLNNDNLTRLHNYIHELEAAKVNRGLYVLDRPYTSEQAAETARLMALDAIATSLAEVDTAKGKITEAQKADAHFFASRYRSSADTMIDRIFAGTKVQQLIPEKDLKHLMLSRVGKSSGSSVNLMAMMIGMNADAAEDKNHKATQTATQATAKQQQELKRLLLKNCKNPENLEFIQSFKDPATFERVSSLVNPRNISRAKRMAQLIPKMKKMVDIATRPEMLELIKMVQPPEMNAYLLELLQDKDIKAKIIAEQQRRIQAQVTVALSKPYSDAMYLILSPGFEQAMTTGTITAMDALQAKIADLIKLRDRLKFMLSMRRYADLIASTDNPHAANMTKILAASSSTVENALNKCSAAIKQASLRYNDYVYAVGRMNEALNNVENYKTALLNSTGQEMTSLVNALQGGYIAPSPGADPIRNPNSIPTGHNLYSIDTESTPTREAWKVAVKLGDELIRAKLKSSGKYPVKTAFTLWGGEFIRSHGVNVAEILYLLGVEPVWNSRGRVSDVRLIPMSKLKRPRIDVVVQTSGQFRGAATSRLYLIDKAVRMASLAEDNGEFENHVKNGSIAAEKVMIAKGYAPLEARKLSTARIFGGVNGNFGTGVMGLAESGDKWEKDSELSQRYLNNMGAIYTRDNWCEFKDGVFEAALQNTDTVVQPRSSNTWGPLSLDHVYEFMGGINMTVRNVTGKSPEIFFNDLRNASQVRVQSGKEAAMVEARTTVLNPKYIKEMMKEGAGAAESFAEVARNSYGWEVMRPEMLEDYYWNDLKSTLIDDKFKLGTRKFFDDKNPYALQEMTAVMLETIRKGYWKADPATIKQLAQIHADSIKKFKAGCSGFVCDNSKLRDMIASALNNKTAAEEYRKDISAARTVSDAARQKIKGMELKKEEVKPTDAKTLIRDNLGALIGIAVVILILGLAMLSGHLKR